MAIVRNQSERDRLDKDAGGRHTELLQLSLQGKWIALARKWLEYNAPCTFDTYLVSVAPMMPTHIKSQEQGKRIDQVALARMALSKLEVAVLDNLVQRPREKQVKQIYDHVSMLKDFLQPDGRVLLPSNGLCDPKLHAFETWLRRRSKRVGKRLFEFNTTT